ncbi:hypothetical protein [Mycobacterium deserti]|uniref:Uncharacterized protein n=1 Tax=Mycobacterium deserti TaxID=2978347 RepID=A0ABT2MI25_9MYCO|nr:hypothetical protein [Mycobacterium deserti]MCT7660750.1 hypothetical protein [Mycobacterium deserti]
MTTTNRQPKPEPAAADSRREFAIRILLTAITVTIVVGVVYFATACDKPAAGEAKSIRVTST